jgi:DNA-binding transcriptional MocR family regulator
MATRRGRRSAWRIAAHFEVIAETLRDQIRSGGLRPGEALPTQAVLMREFGASSLTEQKAMALLKQEGWAVSRPGKGLFVAHHDVADDGGAPGGPDRESAPVGAAAARVEALERALADAVEELAGLRTRVAALEAGGGKQSR